MSEVLTNLEFWKIVAGLAWPAVVLVIFFALRTQVRRIFEREEMDIEVAGLKVHVRDATKQIGGQQTELMQRVAALEAVRGGRSGDDVTLANARTPFSLLWVDDYPSNNAFLIDKFRSDGIDVELSLSTEDALGRIGQRRFNLLISDLGRREGTSDNPFAGLDLLKRLSGGGDRIPSVIYAGRRGLEHERELKAAGANLVTSSPTDVIAFVEHHRKFVAN